MVYKQKELGIGSLVSRLIDDGKLYASAEVRLYREIVVAKLADAKVAAVFFATAFILANAAIVALLVGLILILMRPLGPIWATVIVIGGTFAIVGILGWLGLGHIRSMSAAKASGE